MSQNQSRLAAILGPTNTGKTYYAIERMLARNSGVIGLPLRLLAREVYDKVVALRGLNSVALITGEERIVPNKARYWVCTVEAMPQDIGAEFVAIDEIQLCGDPERGHVFTDRLLNMRGSVETLFLGADTMRKVIGQLIPNVEFIFRSRFSDLEYTGPKKTSRMPSPRRFGAVPTFFNLSCGMPREKVCRYRILSRATSTSTSSDSALTTEMPTPCRPPAVS